MISVFASVHDCVMALLALIQDPETSCPWLGACIGTMLLALQGF